LPQLLAVSPIIEVAEHNAGPGDVYRAEQARIHESNSLLAPFTMRRAEVYVEHMQSVMSNPYVGAKHTSFFPAGDGPIDLPDEFKSPAAEGHVAVYTAAVFSGFPIAK
jgi:hypothetical protein